MKVIRENASNNSGLIIDTAARMFRERGVQGASLADIMQAAGLTHGGFYRPYESKYALARQATDHAAAAMKAGIKRSQVPSPVDSFRNLIETYVSKTHRDALGSGCVLPALAGDPASRSDPELRAILACVVQDYLDQLAGISPSITIARDREQYLCTHSVVVGQSGRPAILT